MILKGNAIKIEGSNRNADAAMGWYLGMDALPAEEIAKKFMSGVSPDIAAAVKPGDILVCGKNFGYGKVHQAMFTAMGVLGIRYIVAESFATQIIQTGLMFGGSFVEVPGILAKVSMGDEIEVDTVSAMVRNLTSGETIQGNPFPPFLREVMEDGGQMRHLAKLVQQRKARGF